MWMLFKPVTSGWDSAFISEDLVLKKGVNSDFSGPLQSLITWIMDLFGCFPVLNQVSSCFSCLAVISGWTYPLRLFSYFISGGGSYKMLYFKPKQQVHKYYQILQCKIVPCWILIEYSIYIYSCEVNQPGGRQLFSLVSSRSESEDSNSEQMWTDQHVVL